MLRSSLVFSALAVAGMSSARADVTADIAAVNAALPACDAARAHCFGIALHMTAVDGALIAKPEWLATQLATADRHFASIDVGFRVVSIDALPASAAHIASRRDRNQLAAGGLHGAVIHVFVIEQLDDVDVPGETRFGVAWHVPDTERKYVILSTRGVDRVLAHELGHVFGLPHSTYPISIMNKTERAEPPVEQRTFASEEVARMRDGMKQLLRAKLVAELPR